MSFGKVANLFLYKKKAGFLAQIFKGFGVINKYISN